MVGLVLRGIPELLVASYPVGYETIAWYAPIITKFHEMTLTDVFVKTFHGGPLFYVFMWLVSTISGAHAFLLLKIVGPVLYGCLAAAFFLFLRRGLGLEWRMAFVASLLMVFQVAALRIAWDRFRNVLGLVFVFAALSMLRSESSKLRWPLVAGLAILTTISREYIGVVLFVAVLGFTFVAKKDRFRSFLSLVPAMIVFGVMVFPSKLWSSYVLTGFYSSESFLWLVQDVVFIFLACYLPLLPFVLGGFERNKMLDSLVGFLLASSFGVVLIPRFAVPGYQRWLMLLVFPFCIYAVLGLKRFGLFGRKNFMKLVMVLLVFGLIGLGYSTGVFSYVGMLPNSYVAVNLVQSSIAWDRLDDVRDVLGWLDRNAPANSSLLAEERFYGWALIYLRRANGDIQVIPYGANSLPWFALERILDDGFRWIYLIWYSDFSVENFRMVYSRNGVAVFRYMH